MPTLWIHLHASQCPSLKGRIQKESSSPAASRLTFPSLILFFLPLFFLKSFVWSSPVLLLPFLSSHHTSLSSSSLLLLFVSLLLHLLSYVHTALSVPSTRVSTFPVPNATQVFMIVSRPLNVRWKLKQLNNQGLVLLFGWRPFYFTEVPTVWKLIMEDK